MIAFLRGTLTAVWPGRAVLDVGGIGYRLLMAAHSHSRLPAIGQTVTLHTHLHVQEDALTLYGFTDPMEVDFFELLLTVSGIGPRLALGIVGTMAPQEFYACVVAADAAALSRLPGIGRKMAQRVILDLREKVAGTQLTDPALMPVASQLLTPGCEALMALGYTYSEAERAIRQVLEDTGHDQDVQQVVELALRHLVRF